MKRLHRERARALKTHWITICNILLMIVLLEISWARLPHDCWLVSLSLFKQETMPSLSSLLLMFDLYVFTCTSYDECFRLALLSPYLVVVDSITITIMRVFSVLTFTLASSPSLHSLRLLFSYLSPFKLRNVCVFIW